MSDWSKRPHAAASAETGETFSCGCETPQISESAIARGKAIMTITQPAAPEADGFVDPDPFDPPQTGLQAAVEREAEFAAHEKTLVTPPTHGVMRDVVGVIEHLKKSIAEYEATCAKLLNDCERVRKVASEALRGPGADLAGDEAMLVQMVVADRDALRADIATLTKERDEARESLRRAATESWSLMREELQAKTAQLATLRRDVAEECAVACELIDDGLSAPGDWPTPDQCAAACRKVGGAK